MRPETWTEHTQAQPLAKLLQIIISPKLFSLPSPVKAPKRGGPTPVANDRPVVIDSTFIG